MQVRNDDPEDFLEKLQNYNSFIPITCEQLNNKHFTAFLQLAPVFPPFKHMCRESEKHYELALGKLVVNHLLGIQFLLLNQPNDLRKKIAIKYSEHFTQNILIPLTSFSVTETYWEEIQKLLSSWMLHDYAEREKKLVEWLKDQKFKGLRNYNSPKPNLPSRPLSSFGTGSYRRDFQRLMLNNIFEHHAFNFSLLSEIRFSIRQFIKVLQQDLSVNEEKILNKNFEIFWFELHKIQLKAFQDISQPNISYFAPHILLGICLILICLTTFSIGGVVLGMIYVGLSLFFISHYRRFDRQIKPACLRETTQEGNNTILNRLYGKFKFSEKVLVKKNKLKAELQNVFEFEQNPNDVNLKVRRRKPSSLMPQPQHVNPSTANSSEQSLSWHTIKEKTPLNLDPIFLHAINDHESDPMYYAYLVPAVLDEIRSLLDRPSFSREKFFSVLHFRSKKGEQGLVDCTIPYKAGGETYTPDYKAKFKGKYGLGRLRVYGFFCGKDTETGRKQLLYFNKAELK